MTPITHLAALLLLLPAVFGQDDGDHWLQWRGPDGTGMAHGTAPASWSSAEDVRWAVDVPGRGCATPIVVGDRIFVTTAVALDATPEPGERGEFHGGGGPQPEHSFELYCLDRNTGATLWKRVATTAVPREGFHRQYGSHASASPVSDGTRVWVSFVEEGVYCYDLAGELLWSTQLGVPVTMRRQFGGGTAPVLAGDALILLCDQEGDSFLAVLDAATGEERWRAARDEPSTWATPLVTEVDGRTQVVCSGTTRVRGYDLASGDVVWECGGLGLNVIPNPLRVGDAVLAMSGYREANLLAIALGKEGDLTGTDAVLWQSAKGTSYTPSPVLRGTEYYCLTDRGFLSAFDAATGEPFYLEERLPRGLLYKASPVGAGDALLLLAETGEVALIRMGRGFEVLAELPSLAVSEDEMFLASPVVVEGALILRSTDRLLCIGPDEK